MFHLVLVLPFDIIWVFKEPFETRELAEKYRAEKFETFNAIEVWDEPTLEQSQLRKFFVGNRSIS